MNALMGMFGAGAPVSKGDKNVDAMSLVSSEFRHMKFQYGPEMIDQMYTAFQRPVYNKIETTTEPIRCFCIDKDGFSVISSDKDLFSSRKPKTIKTDHKRSIRRLAVWDTNDKLGPQVITASNDSTLKVYDVNFNFHSLFSIYFNLHLRWKYNLYITHCLYTEIAIFTISLLGI